MGRVLNTAYNVGCGVADFAGDFFELASAGIGYAFRSIVGDVDEAYDSMVDAKSQRPTITCADLVDEIIGVPDTTNSQGGRR